MEKKDAKSAENAKQPPAKPEGSTNEKGDEVYFFHPLQLVEEREILDEKEIEKSSAEFEQKLQEILTSLNEEVLQLSEFLLEENKIVNELCTALKQILKKFDVSFNIPTKDLPTKRKIEKAILNEEGHLVLLYEKGDVHSAFLAEYPPHIVMTVLWTVMPELAKVIMLYRKKVSARVGFFGKLRKELKGIANAVMGEKEENAEHNDEQTMDAVRDSIKPEGQPG
jgi:hypothetical protein